MTELTYTEEVGFSFFVLLHERFNSIPIENLSFSFFVLLLKCKLGLTIEFQVLVSLCCYLITRT